jgi:hypothetical protein
MVVYEKNTLIAIFHMSQIDTGFIGQPITENSKRHPS